jgi:hypothetical protein
MAVISALLEGSPTTPLLKSLAAVIGGGVMDLRADWSEGEAITAFEVLGSDFEQDVSSLKALLAWADANGVAVIMYRHSVPVSRGTKVAPENRDIILNQLQEALNIRAGIDRMQP